MKKGQVLEGVVERVDFPNKGIVRCGDEVCTVKNTLPGQRIRFSVRKVRNKRAEGSLLEVLQKAPGEAESPCPHFGSCGGCSYQTLPYELQLQLKEEQVKRLLAPVLEKQERGYDEVFEPIQASPVQEEYRNKMEFTFGDEVKGGPLALGMHKRGSFYDIVTVSSCRLMDQDYRTILRCVLDFFRESGVSFYHRLRHEGYLRHLLIRKARRTGEILVALVTTTQEEHDLSGLTQRLLALQAAGTDERAGLEGRIVGILHTKNDSPADIVQSDETEILYGQDYFYEELLGLKFRVTEFSFFQTNSLGAEVLYNTVREFIKDLGEGKKDRVIFDLYSGTGTIAQLMAPVAGKVIGVEIVEEAVEAARENARLNGLHNCEFIAGDVLKALDTIGETPDLIILDPPRDGIHPKALPKILRYGVENIIYISCKPTSLARDLELFLAGGYEVKRGRAVDQFVGTGHVEVCVELRRK